MNHYKRQNNVAQTNIGDWWRIFLPATDISEIRMNGIAVTVLSQKEAVFVLKNVWLVVSSDLIQLFYDCWYTVEKTRMVYLKGGVRCSDIKKELIDLLIERFKEGRRTYEVLLRDNLTKIWQPYPSKKHKHMLGPKHDWIYTVFLYWNFKKKKIIKCII